MSTPLMCVVENGVSPNDIELHDIGTKFYLVEFFLIYLSSLPRKLRFVFVSLFVCSCSSVFLSACMITQY